MSQMRVSLDDELVKRVDAMVGKRRRGRFLKEAAWEKLERLELESAIREGAGLLRDRDYPHWHDTESVQQWVRTSRGGSS